eukprot:SAG31_NODE_2114_length_6416_cov_25.024379_2_plen_60_part_00
MRRGRAGCACALGNKTPVVVLGGASDESPIALEFLKVRQSFHASVVATLRVVRVSRSFV